METTAAQLKKGQKGIIKTYHAEHIPLKLLEMGCLPGNEIELLHIAPLKDPLYININGSHLAIRKETAKHIEIEVVE